MDERIAQELIALELARIREKPHSELVKFVGHPEHRVARTRDGKTYQLEVEAFWDNRKGGDVRVIVSADDGGLRAFVPVTDDFIKAPDGSFVGE